MNRFFLLVLLVARPLVAQSDSVSRTLFTARDGKIAVGFLATTAAISYFDPKIARFFTNPALSHVRTGQRLDDVFTKINETTLTIAGIAAYGVGRMTKSPTITDVGFHVTEAVVTASLASQLVRGPLGRSRPMVTNLEDQYDFNWFKGFREFDYRAFPSIHSGSGFAAATVLVQETRRRKPGAVKVVAPIAYALALTPGLSRMYLGQHWASDIFAGAFVGTFAGMKVVNYSHTHPGNRFQDFFVPAKGLSFTMDKGTLGASWGSTF